MKYTAKSGNVATVKERASGRRCVVEVIWCDPVSDEDMAEFDTWYTANRHGAVVVDSRLSSTAEQMRSECDKFLARKDVN